MGIVRRRARSWAAAVCVAAAGSWIAAGGGGLAPPERSALAHSAPASFSLTLTRTWRRSITVAQPNVIALSSPGLATLTGGPAVVVGSRDQHVYAFHLGTGGTVAGWPKNVGAPVTSPPSAVTLPGTAHSTVVVGTGNAGSPCVGGYQWLYPNGRQTIVLAKNPPDDYACNYRPNGVIAGVAIGKLDGSAGAVAGSMGQETYAMNAATRAVLPGFPWFQADSNFSTPAIADLGSSGQNEIVEGGASTAGVAFGRTYTNGGHIRVLNQAGGRVCELTTNESINSSPAVGRFLPGTAIGIVAGTGPTYPTASQHDQVIAVNSACQEVWSRTLPGTTGYESPALADVLGNGRLQVVVTTRTPAHATRPGYAWALTGANGNVIWQRSLVRESFSSPVTAELGTGRQVVVVTTINGFDVLTGTNGAVLVATRTITTGFQNAALVTDDPNGTVGITVAGYQVNNSVVEHFEIASSNGSKVDARGAWPQFHHDPQLTGNADAPIVPLQAFPAGRIAGTTADATAAKELEQQFPPGTSCPGVTGTRPVVLATDATFPDALASAPLAAELGTGTLLTPGQALSTPTAAALAAEGITHVDVVGGHLAVSTTVVSQLEATHVSPCGGGSPLAATITVTRLWGTTAYTTADDIAKEAVALGGGVVPSLDLSGAYAGTNPSGGTGRFNDTWGHSSPGPSGPGALTTAILATGQGFQDAMSASTLAYADRLPILLTGPSSLSTQARAAIGALGVRQVIVMGGPFAVSTSVVTALEHLSPAVSVVRVAGLDFTDTADELARLETTPSPTGVGWHGTGTLTVARGDFYADGLAGAVVAANGPASSSPEPLVLTLDPSSPGSSLGTFLHQAGTSGIGGTPVTSLVVLGGTLAVTPTAVDEMGADL